MITSLKRLPGLYRFLPKQIFLFSQQNLIKLHKAILATKIEKIISNNPPNQYSSSTYRSLKQDILREIDNYDKDSKDSENQKSAQYIAKQKLKKYFVEGIWVHRNLCNQTGFYQKQQSYTTLTQNNQQIEMNLDSMKKDEIFQSKFRQLRFCPTYFVTSQIFRKIQNSSQFFLLTGQHQIGKTYSFILYKLISEIIHNYKHLNCQEHPQVLKSQINYQIPKVIYLNVDLSKTKQDISEESIERQFLLQCYEIKTMNLSCGLFSMKEKLQQIYDRLGIQIVLLVDQINQLAEAIAQYQKCKRQYQDQQQLQRNRSQKVTQIKNHSEQKKQKQNDQKKLQQLRNKYQISQLKYKKYEMIQQVLNKIIQKRHFKRVIYLSSFNIKKDYLERLMLAGSTKYIYVFPQRISYPLILKGTTAITDVCQLVSNAFVGQYLDQKIYKLQNKSEYMNLISRIKYLLFNLMHKQTFIMALPFAITNKILNSPNAKLQYLLDKDKQNRLQQQLVNLMNQIYVVSTQKTIEKLNKFIKNPALTEKAQKIKNIIIFKLLIKSKLKFIQMQQNQVRNFEEQINLDLLQNKQNIQSNNLNIPNSFYSGNNYLLSQMKLKEKQKNILSLKLNSNFDEQLFSIVETIPDNILVCHVNLYVLMTVLQNNAKQLYTSLLASNEQILRHIEGAAEGIFIQNIFVQMLKKKGTKLSFSSNYNIEHNIIFDQIYQKVYCFLPIPTIYQNNYGKYSFFQGFSAYIKKVENNVFYNDRPVLMLPLLKVHHKRQQQIDQKGIKYTQIDHRNKLIDFILTMFSVRSNNQQFLQIYAFAITISLNQVLQKIWKFILEYMNFIDNQKNIIKIYKKDTFVKLHYIVLSPRAINYNLDTYFIEKLRLLKQEKNKEAQIQKQSKQSIKSKNTQDINYQIKVLQNIIFKKNGNMYQIRLKNGQKKTTTLLSTIRNLSFLYDIAIDNQINPDSIMIEKKLLESY